MRVVLPVAVQQALLHEALQQEIRVPVLPAVQRRIAELEAAEEIRDARLGHLRQWGPHGLWSAAADYLRRCVEQRRRDVAWPWVSGRGERHPNDRQRRQGLGVQALVDLQVVERPRGCVLRPEVVRLADCRRQRRWVFGESERKGRRTNQQSPDFRHATRARGQEISISVGVKGPLIAPGAVAIDIIMTKQTSTTKQAIFFPLGRTAGRPGDAQATEVTRTKKVGH